MKSEILGHIQLGRQVKGAKDAAVLAVRLNNLIQGAHYIIIDCSDTEEIDDQALRELARTSQALSGLGKMILLQPSKEMRAALRHAAMYDFFYIAVTWKGAIDHVYRR